MKTKSAKAKGRRAQSWLRDKLLALFPSLEPDDVKSCPMGVNGEDIQLSPAARRLLPYAFEAKSRATIAVYKWLEQGSGAYPPVVIAKADRKRPIAIMYVDDFLALLERRV